MSNFKTLWNRSNTLEEAAIDLGLTPEMANRTAQVLRDRGFELKRFRENKHNAPPTPTPDEIESEARKIRQAWVDDPSPRRCGGHYQIPSLTPD